MNYYFDYDFKRDFPKQTKWAISGSYIIGIAMLVISYTLVFSDNNYGNLFKIGCGVFILLGGGVFIIMGLRLFKNDLYQKR